MHAAYYAMQVCETVCWFVCLPASPHLSSQHRRLFSVFLYSGSAAREWRAIKASYAYLIPSCHGCVLLARLNRCGRKCDLIIFKNTFFSMQYAVTLFEQRVHVALVYVYVCLVFKTDLRV